MLMGPRDTPMMHCCLILGADWSTRRSGLALRLQNGNAHWTLPTGIAAPVLAAKAPVLAAWPSVSKELWEVKEGDASLELWTPHLSNPVIGP